MSKLGSITLGIGGVGAGIASFLFGAPSFLGGSHGNGNENQDNENQGKAVGAPQNTGVANPAGVMPEDFFRLGHPGPIHDVGKRTEFITCYDRQKRHPLWVIEHITKESLARSAASRKNSFFKEDTAIPFLFRAKLKDYFNSGYDRGHNAPAADAKFSQWAMNETFLLSNITPQVGEGFNRDYWSYFEHFTRQLTEKYDDVRIMTGPLYLPALCEDGKYRVTYEVIGPVGQGPNVSVPTHFFKLIVGQQKKSSKIAVGAFVMPNNKIDDYTPLQTFQVPVESLERATGLELLRLVAPENQLNLCMDTDCDLKVEEFKQKYNLLSSNKGALPSPSGSKA